MGTTIIDRTRAAWWTRLLDEPIECLSQREAYSLGVPEGFASAENCTVVEMLESQGLL